MIQCRLPEPLDARYQVFLALERSRGYDLADFFHSFVRRGFAIPEDHLDFLRPANHSRHLVN